MDVLPELGIYPSGKNRCKMEISKKEKQNVSGGESIAESFVIKMTFYLRNEHVSKVLLRIWNDKMNILYKYEQI